MTFTLECSVCLIKHEADNDRQLTCGDERCVTIISRRQVQRVTSYYRVVCASCETVFWQESTLGGRPRQRCYSCRGADSSGRSKFRKGQPSESTLYVRSRCVDNGDRLLHSQEIRRIADDAIVAYTAQCETLQESLDLLAELRDHLGGAQRR